MDDRWVAIDFETATRSRTSACALGLAVVERGLVTETRSWLIRPPRNAYEYWNIQVHGIRPADTEHAPSFAQLWPEIAPYLDGAALLAHNASFDIGVLRRSAEEFGFELPRARYACTVTMSRRAFPTLHAHKLDIVCRHCGIELQHHEAQSDAVACATVALRCRDALAASTITEACEWMGLEPARL